VRALGAATMFARAMTHATMLFLAALAADPPAVAVLSPAAGSAARARLEVETALSDRGGLEIVPLDRWRAAAAEARVPRAAATAPASVPRVAPRAGADAVVLLAPRARRGARLVRARLVDASGRELWSGTYEVIAGALGAANARDVASSVAGALLPARAPPPVEPPPPPPREPEVAPPPPVVAAPPARRPPPRAAATAAPEPALRFELGVPLTWRNADIPATQTNGPGTYRTGTPYFGILADVRVAPLRLGWAGRVPAWAEPFQLDASFSERFLSSELSASVPGGAPTSITSREVRFGVDLRYPWQLPTRTRIAARAGYALHHFAVADNPVLPSSNRSGFRLGVDAEHTVLRWATAELQARVYPKMGPGSAERAQFGPDGSGWGYEIAVGASGPLPQVYPGLGWRLAYDFLHFSDSFSGGFASASPKASYHSVVVSATYSR
jgi:hypothetical protein